MLKAINSKHKGLLLMCSGWSILLSIGALLPHDFINGTMRISPNALPILHFIGYGLLAFIISHYVREKHGFITPQSAIKIIFVAFLLTSIIGSITELLQFLTTDRTPDLGDLKVDLLGGMIGVMIFLIAGRTLKKSIKHFKSTSPIIQTGSAS